MGGGHGIAASVELPYRGKFTNLFCQHKDNSPNSPEPSGERSGACHVLIDGVPGGAAEPDGAGAGFGVFRDRLGGPVGYAFDSLACGQVVAATASITIDPKVSAARRVDFRRWWDS